MLLKQEGETEPPTSQHKPGLLYIISFSLALGGQVACHDFRANEWQCLKGKP